MSLQKNIGNKTQREYLATEQDEKRFSVSYGELFDRTGGGQEWH